MIIRSCAKWTGDGEFFSFVVVVVCKLEKRNFVQRSMCFIQKDNGEIIHDNKSVIIEAKYASKEADIQDEAIDENLDNPTRTSEERDIKIKTI